MKIVRDTYYDITLSYRVGHKVVFHDFANPIRYPDIWTVIAISQETNPNAEPEQLLAIKNDITGEVLTGIPARDSLRYETYMIFRLMATLNRLFNQRLPFEDRVDLP